MSNFHTSVLSRAALVWLFISVTGIVSNNIAHAESNLPLPPKYISAEEAARLAAEQLSTTAIFRLGTPKGTATQDAIQVLTGKMEIPDPTHTGKTITLYGEAKTEDLTQTLVLLSDDATTPYRAEGKCIDNTCDFIIVVLENVPENLNREILYFQRADSFIYEKESPLPLIDKEQKLTGNTSKLLRAATAKVLAPPPHPKQQGRIESGRWGE
jgi:hypothetical protein